MNRTVNTVEGAGLGHKPTCLHHGLKLNLNIFSGIQLDFTEKFQLIRSRPGLIQIVGVIPLQSQEREERSTQPTALSPSEPSVIKM